MPRGRALPKTPVDHDRADPPEFNNPLYQQTEQEEVDPDYIEMDDPDDYTEMNAVREDTGYTEMDAVREDTGYTEMDAVREDPEYTEMDAVNEDLGGDDDSFSSYSDN